MTEDNAVDGGAEDIKTENDVRPDIKAQPEQKNKPKKKAKLNQKNVTAKPTPEIVDEILRINKEEGTKLTELCEKYGFTYNTFNNFRKKQEDNSFKSSQQSSNTQSRQHKNTGSINVEQYKKLEADFDLLSKMYLKLSLEHQRILDEK